MTQKYIIRLSTAEREVAFLIIQERQSQSRKTEKGSYPIESGW